MINNEEKRMEILIKEREEYENEFFSDIVDDMIESDEIDHLISDRFEYIDEYFDFEPSPEYQHMEELYFDRHCNYNGEEKDDSLIDYTIDDEFEEGYDYPEGPEENMGGVYFNESYYKEPYEWQLDNEPDFDDVLDEQYEYYEKQQERLRDEYYQELYNDVVSDVEISDDMILEFEKQEEYIQSLIKSHLEEEKEYLQRLLIETIQDEQYFQKAIDEIIFEEIDIEYDSDKFDYNESKYWYQKSAKNSFNEKTNAEENEFKIRNHKLIKGSFKRHISKNDNLNNLIKRKLKEKKFLK